METGILMGMDLGQSRDPSAIAVVEREELQGEWDPARYRVAEASGAAPAVPGADSAGDAVSGEWWSG